MTFAACLPIILASEGGYVVDQGGPTNFGITQRALAAYLRRPVTVDEVKNLDPAGPVVSGLYEADYYNAAHCPDCPAGVDLMVFDEAVNEGVGRAIRHLQESLGVTADGRVGPVTLAAVQAADPAALINAIHDTNADYYLSLATLYPQDEKGWSARNDRTKTQALAMVVE